MRVYAIFDRALREYGNLIQAKNDEVIRRMVVDSFKGSKSAVELHPEDYDVMHVGYFDPEKGELSGDTPTLVVNISVVLSAAGGGNEIGER